ALLTPRLLAAAAHERAVLRGVRAATPRRVRAHDRFPHEVRIHAPAEHVVAHVDRADLFVLVVYDIQLHRVTIASRDREPRTKEPKNPNLEPGTLNLEP